MSGPAIPNPDILKQKCWHVPDDTKCRQVFSLDQAGAFSQHCMFVMCSLPAASTHNNNTETDQDVSCVQVRYFTLAAETGSMLCL